ncbi:MAG TPA: electron transfer flavoprotein subunit alpha/FixB family protein [Chitinophagaceae bacterium]|nr:electron transfer flavoprotein subunit alpha/FixB family protein [Chitinophagaceae bacterium]
MSVLVYIDTADGHIKKASLEALCYGSKLAGQLQTACEALVLGQAPGDLASLGKYGAAKVYQVAGDALNQYDAQVYSKAIAQAVVQTGASVLVFSNNVNGKGLAPMVSVRLKAGLVTGAVALPDTSQGFVVKKNVFSGKAYLNLALTTDTRIIALNPNAFPVSAGDGAAQVVPLAIPVEAGRVRVTSVNKASGEVPLTEAETVVSGGRGLKGPENWGMLEDLAQVLHAATACSRPVADAHWRPHHEHVGQTGIAISPNLYIAIGISGAIQHLAGVNRSKVIVVINKDPEAPFFKAADYGIVGDAFDVVPKLTESIKKLKGLS